MFTRATGALVLLLSPLAAMAQPSDRYPVHTVSFPGGVTGRPNLVVSWYGDLPLSQEASDPDVAAFLGCAPCGPADIAMADPMTFASSTAPPMLTIQGTADTGVSITQSQAMAKKLAELKVPVETLTIPDVGHGLVGKTSQITRAANDQALARTLKFIDALFGR